jgi:small-conductance mechanosensitive channel
MMAPSSPAGLLVAQVIDPGQVEELIDTRNVTAWDYLWAALTVITAFLIAYVVKRVLGRSLEHVHGIPPRIASLITTATTWSIRLLGIVFALPFIGVDIGPVVIFIIILLALLVVAGRVILENFGAGLILQTRAPFRIGDEIVTLDYDGRVEDINGRSVVLLTQDGKRVAVPNTLVLNSPIVTLTTHENRRSELTVGVEYATDLDRAREVLLAAMDNVPGVVDEPAPEAYVVEYADSSIDFLVRFWHPSDILSGYVVTDEVARAINRALRAHGIVIAFPQRTLWWGEGDRNDRP